MATRYTCTQHKQFRIRRPDGTYIEFVDGEFDAYTPADRTTLAQFPFVHEFGEVANTTGRTYPRLKDGVISWWSPLLGVADGYGNSAEKIIAAVDAPGSAVSVEAGYQLSAPETLIRKILDRPLVHGATRVAYCPPHQAYWRPKFPEQAVIGFTMWEDDTVPPAWAKSFPQVDAIATCSRFNAEQFARFCTEHGIDVPVVYVPLGVAHTLFPYKRRAYKPGATPFTFLHTSTGMNDPRKGAAEAYQAFRTAFRDREDVRIIFRAKFGNLDVAGDKRVVFRTGTITEEQKRDLLYEAHAFVYPSFGEGFGLMPLEAIASGLPTICALNTSMLDYADLFFAGVQCDPEPSRIVTPFQARSFGRWQRPRHAEIVSGMRRTFAEYQQATMFAAKAAKQVRAEWGYDRSADALRRAITIARDRRDALIAA